MEPTLHPSQLTAVNLVYQSQLRLSNMDCSTLISCGTPCIQSIIEAQAKVEGSSASYILFVNCTDSVKRRLSSLQTPRFKKHVEVIKNVIVITKTIIPVSEGAFVAQLIFKNTTTALSSAAQMGLLTVVIRNISSHNNAFVLSTVIINSALSELADINTVTTDSSALVTVFPSCRYTIYTYIHKYIHTYTYIHTYKQI